MAHRIDDLPCGNCDAGIYAAEPVIAGLSMFGGCSSRKEALACAPRCKRDSGHICFGARDWIRGQTFPMSEAERNAILEEYSA